MNTISLALGSNLGNKKAYIYKAIELLKEKVAITAIAPIYESIPVGYTKQDNFYNTALQATTALSPLDLLRFIKDIEKKIGRKKRFVNGPREIDIDIIFYANKIIQEDGLTIPHPRMHERDFVLKPLADTASKTRDPISKKTVQELLNALPEEKKAVLTTITDK